MNTNSLTAEREHLANPPTPNAVAQIVSAAYTEP